MSLSTNYKGKTNEQLAIEFLNSMVEKEKKTEKHFSILVNKYKAWDKEGVSDIVNATIEKVYLTILTNGFEKGYFQAYFEEALKNNLVQHLMKLSRKAVVPITVYYSTEQDEEELALAAYEQERIDKMLFAFNQLPESSKETLNMLYDEQKYREIQRSLGLTVGQVKMRIRKARALVAEYMALYPEKMWETLQEAPGYSISRLGQVRNDTTGKFIKLKNEHNTYVVFPFKEEKYPVHELVYKYFGDEHAKLGYAYHVDGNTKNNHIDNLLFDCY